MFDDFLELSGQNFDDCVLVVLIGASGSGKSTALSYLAETHPSFSQKEKQWILGGPISWSTISPTAQLLFVDEVRHPKDVAMLFLLALRGSRLVVASHIGSIAFLPFRFLGRMRAFSTDTEAEKLERYLQKSGISYSQAALERFVATYGATFTDLEIILERSPIPDFDTALRRFEAFDRLQIWDSSLSSK